MWGASAILQPILKILVGPAGRIVLVVLAGLAWTTYQRMDAAQEARAMCRADQLTAELAKQKLLTAAADQAARSARQQADQTEALIEGLERQRDELLQAATLSTQSCDAWTPAFVDGLRDIK